MLGGYGIKNPKAVDEKTIMQYSQKYNVPLQDSYVLDSLYTSFLPADTSRYKDQQKNHNQPLQALYFNNAGQLQSFHINCYAPGFPNLKWNYNSAFETFPPKQQAPVDSFITLTQLIKYMRPLGATQQLSVLGYDNIAVVFWNKFMGRQSKRLIHTVQENSKLLQDKKMKIIYVNNDNIFALADNQN